MVDNHNPSLKDRLDLHKTIRNSCPVILHSNAPHDAGILEITFSNFHCQMRLLEMNLGDIPRKHFVFIYVIKEQGHAQHVFCMRGVTILVSKLMEQFYLSVARQLVLFCIFMPHDSLKNSRHFFIQSGVSYKSYRESLALIFPRFAQG